MIQVTNIQDLKTAVNQNGEMVITMNNNDIVIMKMEEYREKILKEDIEKHLLRAEDDIRNGRVRDAKKFLKNGKRNMEYSIKLADQFLEEFEEICDYISNKLKNIDASNRLREKVIDNVLLLENSPKMYTKIEKTDRTERQYRRMVIDNYVILYTIEDI